MRTSIDPNATIARTIHLLRAIWPSRRVKRHCQHLPLVVHAPKRLPTTKPKPSLQVNVDQLPRLAMQLSLTPSVASCQSANPSTPSRSYRLWRASRHKQRAQSRYNLPHLCILRCPRITHVYANLIATRPSTLRPEACPPNLVPSPTLTHPPHPPPILFCVFTPIRT